MTRPQPLYIVARTLHHAKMTATDRGLPPSPWTREWAWVQGPDMIRGLRDLRVVVGYGATERKDWPELHEQLVCLGAEFVE